MLGRLAGRHDDGVAGREVPTCEVGHVLGGQGAVGRTLVTEEADTGGAEADRRGPAERGVGGGSLLRVEDLHLRRQAVEGKVPDGRAHAGEPLRDGPSVSARMEHRRDVVDHGVDVQGGAPLRRHHEVLDEVGHP